MKARSIILFLFFSSKLIFAQDKKEQRIQFQFGGCVTQPHFSATPNYQIGISDSVVQIARDSLRRYAGFNFESSYLIGITKNIYFKIGLSSNFYGMTSWYYREGSVPYKDSTFYLYHVKLRTIEIPIGIEYNIKIKRSYLFAGIALSAGLIPFHYKVQKAYDWNTLDQKGRTNINIKCDKFYFAGMFNIGFSQYLTQRMKLYLSYQQHQQLNSLKLINQYYRVRFTSKSINLGLTIYL